MNIASPIGADHGPVVTSSDLVRRFGVWQERAARSPVYILHRGRPRFVLTSVEVMDALCAPHSDSDGGQIEALLDTIPDIVLLLDHELQVTALSRAARAYFGPALAPGAPFERIDPLATQSFAAAAARRVLDTGTPESFDIPSPTHPPRRLAIAFSPRPGGLLLVAQDGTIGDELRQAEGEAAAMADAFTAVSGVAVARINLRGYVDTPGAALATLTGLSADALASVRFVTLLDISARVDAAEAIEAVIADGKPRSVAAPLLINRGSARAVRIGFAALRRGAVIDAVQAVLAHDFATS